MTTTTVDRPIVVARTQENVYAGDVIVRHRRVSRLIHWSVAFFFFLSLITGMPIWAPIFRWMAFLVGGLELARIIHPYAGVIFFVLSGVQFFHWLGDMHFTSEERGWWRPSRLMAYMRPDAEIEEGGKYNAGQKGFFFAVCLGALLLLLTGIVMWFPLYFPSVLVREISILLHDIVFIFYFVAIVFHIYLGTAAEPGTFRSMTRGTVSRSWARLHHPGWLRRIKGE